MKDFRCSTCGSTEFKSYTYRGRISRGEIYRRCKPCSLAATEAWKRNPDNPLAVAYRARSLAVRRARRQRWNVAIRAAVLAGLGGACVCCGETEAIFLDVDHVKNDGAHTNRGYQEYRRVVAEKFPSDRYQLLCRNCNWGKFRNGGVCPHKTATSTAKSL